MDLEHTSMLGVKCVLFSAHVRVLECVGIWCLQKDIHSVYVSDVQGHSCIWNNITDLFIISTQ